MRLTVTIPTHARPDKLAACLASLSPQLAEVGADCLVAIDGPDPRSLAVAARHERVRAFELPKRGYIPARRALLERTEADLTLWLNDDVRCDPGLLAAHVRAHEGGACVGAGSQRWRPVPEPTLFDRVVQRTDLIFFRQPEPLERRADIGFRNCFGLNMSFPTALARELGGVPELVETYGYDDAELAHRLSTGASCPVVLVPGAAVEHDHRYGAADVARREYALGRAACAYARVHPVFARDCFGREILSDDELAHTERCLVRDRRDAERAEADFLALGGLAADAASEALLPALAHAWVPLKRYLWRWGLLDAVRGSGARWSLLSDAPELP